MILSIVLEMSLSYAPCVYSLRDARIERLEGNKRKRGAKTSRYIFKARGGTSSLFLCKDSSRRQWKVVNATALLYVLVVHQAA